MTPGQARSNSSNPSAPNQSPTQPGVAPINKPLRQVLIERPGVLDIPSTFPYDVHVDAREPIRGDEDPIPPARKEVFKPKKLGGYEVYGVYEAKTTDPAANANAKRKLNLQTLREASERAVSLLLQSPELRPRYTRDLANSRPEKLADLMHIIDTILSVEGLYGRFDLAANSVLRNSEPGEELLTLKYGASPSGADVLSLAEDIASDARVNRAMQRSNFRNPVLFAGAALAGSEFTSSKLKEKNQWFVSVQSDAGVENPVSFEEYDIGAWKTPSRDAAHYFERRIWKWCGRSVSEMLKQERERLARELLNGELVGIEANGDDELVTDVRRALERESSEATRVRSLVDEQKIMEHIKGSEVQKFVESLGYEHQRAVTWLWVWTGGPDARHNRTEKCCELIVACLSGNLDADEERLGLLTVWEGAGIQGGSARLEYLSRVISASPGSFTNLVKVNHLSRRFNYYQEKFKEWLDRPNADGWQGDENE